MKTGLKLLLFLLTGLAAAGSALGADLADYRERVWRALEEVDLIKEDLQYGEEGAEYIKASLPLEETVQVDSQNIQVNNLWVHVLVDSFLSGGTPEQRLKKLAELESKLGALDAHLQRTSAEPSSDPRGRLENILSRPEYKEKEESPIAKLSKAIRRKLIEILTELMQRIFAGVGGTATGSWILKGLMLAAGLTCAYLVARMVMRRRRPKRPREPVSVLGEEIAADVTPASLASAAMAAAGAGEFRTAIRKLYVALLYELSERRLIDIEPDATNRDYLSKLVAFASLAPSMVYLTEKFDYFWYGMYPSSRDDFSSYLEKYREAVASARSLTAQPA
jgi:hypothetical protein